jgi:hypothetical protein
MEHIIGKSIYRRCTHCPSCGSRAFNCNGRGAGSSSIVNAPLATLWKRADLTILKGRGLHILSPKTPEVKNMYQMKRHMAEMNESSKSCI